MTKVRLKEVTKELNQTAGLIITETDRLKRNADALLQMLRQQENRFLRQEDEDRQRVKLEQQQQLMQQQTKAWTMPDDETIAADVSADEASLRVSKQPAVEVQTPPASTAAAGIKGEAIPVLPAVEKTIVKTEDILLKSEETPLRPTAEDIIPSAEQKEIASSAKPARPVQAEGSEKPVSAPPIRPAAGSQQYSRPAASAQQYSRPAPGTQQYGRPAPGAQQYGRPAPGAQQHHHDRSQDATPAGPRKSAVAHWCTSSAAKSRGQRSATTGES